MARAARAKRATKARGSQVHPAQYPRVLRTVGIKYKTTRQGITVLGRGRAPRPVFPKAKYKIIRKLTY